MIDHILNVAVGAYVGMMAIELLWIARAVRKELELRARVEAEALKYFESKQK